MKRMASVIQLKPGMAEQYKKLHAEASEEIIAAHRRYHYTNFSIFYKDDYLFSYIEYTGDNWQEDQKRMGEDPVMIQWRKTCRPLMQPLPTRKEGEWQALMDMVFHME